MLQDERQPAPHDVRGDDLFFAILPERDEQARIAALTDQVRREYGLSARPIAPECLHVSLQWAGEMTHQPANLVAAAKQAGAAITAPPFLVSFDRVLSFKGRDRKPLVLATSEDLIALASLHEALGREIRRAGLGSRRRSSFEPHVTLLYDEKHVPQLRVEPIAWMVHEFVLVQNRRGHGQHIQHARWALRA